MFNISHIVVARLKSRRWEWHDKHTTLAFLLSKLNNVYARRLMVSLICVHNTPSRRRLLFAQLKCQILLLNNSLVNKFYLE